MKTRKTLNVGCGERTFEEYPEGYKCINYDERSELENLDMVGDVRTLPYPNKYFDYLLCSDIIEHFPIKETVTILTEWKRVLKIDGIIEFRLPDLYSICKQYMQGTKNAKITSYHLFGGQQYSGNFHYVCFDYEWFIETVKSVTGFIEIEHRPSGSNNLVIKFKKLEEYNE